MFSMTTSSGTGDMESGSLWDSSLEGGGMDRAESDERAAEYWKKTK